MLALKVSMSTQENVISNRSKESMALCHSWCRDRYSSNNFYHNDFKFEKVRLMIQVQEKGKQYLCMNSNYDFEIKDQDRFFYHGFHQFWPVNKDFCLSHSPHVVYIRRGTEYLLDSYQRRKVPMFQMDTSWCPIWHQSRALCRVTRLVSTLNWKREKLFC